MFSIRSCFIFLVHIFQVDKLAQAHSIHLRTGCFCNMGACQQWLQLSPLNVIHNFKVPFISLSLWYIKSILYILNIDITEVKAHFLKIHTFSLEQVIDYIIVRFIVDLSEYVETNLSLKGVLHFI